MPKDMRHGFVLGLVSVVLAGSGCEAVAEDLGPVRRMVGEVDRELFVAVVADDRDMVAYACDGIGTTVSVTEWFQGTHDDGVFELTSERTGARIEGEFIIATGQGTLHLEGDERSFSVVEAEGDEGLHFDEVVDDEGAEHWGGWIVSESGDIRGSVLNRQTGGIVAAGNATPRSTIMVSGLDFEVLRLEAPVL